jgi:hypothetical protein
MEIGDIVQIVDKKERFYPCLLIVTEVKSWGIQGYLHVPGKGQAYYRIGNGKFVVVGHAVLVAE